MSRIAFYAPIKPPDHHIASGDRLIARNLMAALELAGQEVQLASRYIAYSKRPADEILQARKLGALAEAETLIHQLQHDRPDLWLTYHPYCKAPDWIGPRVSEALNIPYVTVEAARTGQGFENGGDLWCNWRAEAQQGMRKAVRHLAFKPTDRNFLTGLLGSDRNIRMIPPFIDTHRADGVEPALLPAHWRRDVPVLVATGMMRPGKKLENYRLLSKALAPLHALHWNLIVIGDGPQREKVESFFTGLSPDRLLFTGAIGEEGVLSHMAAADLFVWPGWREPIGMVYLEAQLMGLPVAALNSMGVPLSVIQGETGLLAPEDDLAGMTENLANLISHPGLRTDLARNCSSHIRHHHSLAAAANAITSALEDLIRPKSN